MSWTENNQWKTYIISCVIASMGAYIIHAKFNKPINLVEFFTWLPAVWLYILVLAFLFSLVLSRSEKK